MATTSSQRGLSVPVVSSDSGLWGSELNTTLADLDTILGATTIIQSSAGLSQTLTTSMAQTQRINVQGSPTGTMTLTFPSSLYANGLYSVWNTTASSLAFGVLCQTTGAGATCTVPVNSQRLVQVDGTNAYFADQIPLPSFNIPPILNNYLSGMIVSNSSNTGLTITAGIAADQSNACYMPFGGMTKSAGSLWAAGSGNGAMGNGLGFSPGLTYHIFEISNSTNNASSNIASSSVDIYFDTSITAANAPTNTNFYRRILSLKTFSSAPVWRPFLQNADTVQLQLPVQDANGISLTATPTLQTLSAVPTGLNLTVFGGAGAVEQGGANDCTLYIWTPGLSNYTGQGLSEVGIAHSRGIPVTGGSAVVQIGSGYFQVLTNQSAQINWAVDGVGSAGYLATYGWIDQRGKNGPP